MLDLFKILIGIFLLILIIPLLWLLIKLVIWFFGWVFGGFLGGLIGIGGDGWLSSILLAVGGSCVVVWLARKIAR